MEEWLIWGSRLLWVVLGVGLFWIARARWLRASGSMAYVEFEGAGVTPAGKEGPEWEVAFLKGLTSPQEGTKERKNTPSGQKYLVLSLSELVVHQKPTPKLKTVLLYIKEWFFIEVKRKFS